MSKQWTIVLVVIAALVLGAAALVRFAPGAGRVEIGTEAPTARAVNLATGDTVVVPDAYRGHVTLVNIWATWCVPCRAEMPAMQEVYVDLKDRGFRIAAVSIDEGSADNVRTFVRELGLTFDILHDRSGRIQRIYQTTGVPESFLLDENGAIVKRVIGAHDWASAVNRELIERYLDESES